ncbi:MAG: helix-turn-helix domain-containing protein [Lysobacterales bacterium]
MPSAKAIATNPVKRSIGALLKARRKELGMTLQELAEASDLSAAFLSQAERGKATPSIISLINIARALQTDVNYFITPPAPTSMVRRADDPVFVEIDSPIVYHQLNADIRNQQLSALMMEIPPGTALPTSHRDQGEDFFYVIEGEIEHMIGGETFVLKAGDCVHHNTQVDHSAANRSKHAARVLWVGTPVLFPSGQDKS